MPSITVGGFQIRVIPGDHEPPHVHVYGKSGSAIFVISPDIVLREQGSMNSRDERRAAEAIFSVYDELMDLWEQYGNKK